MKDYAADDFKAIRERMKEIESVRTHKPVQEEFKHGATGATGATGTAGSADTWC